MSIIRMGRWLWDSDTGEFFEPLMGAKGGVSTPPPTATERALQQKQLQLLNAQQQWALQQQSEQQSLAPFLYAQMGLKRIADPTQASQITDLTTQLQEARARFAKMAKPMGRLVYEKGVPVRIQISDSGNGVVNRAKGFITTPNPVSAISSLFGDDNPDYRDFTPAERKWVQEQAKIQKLSKQLKGLKSAPTKYTFEKMSDEELRAQMSPEERQSADIRNLANQRTLKALEGKLDVDSAVEDDITRGRGQLQQELLQKLGVGAEGSDSWNRAMSEFDRNMNALRYSVRHGEMTTADALATNRINQNMQRQEQALGNLHDSTRNYSVSAATLSGANQGMDSALSRFYSIRRDQAGINAQNQANQGALVGAGIGGGVAIGGAAIIAI